MTLETTPTKFVDAAGMCFADPRAAMRSANRRHRMSRLALVGMAAILSASIAGPVLAAGRETTTRPWLAPVGHRQPRTADIPASPSPSQQTLDQEDAYVDRKISNVCRGC